MDRLLRSLWRLAKVAAVVAAVVAGLVWVSKRRAREEPQVAPPVWPPLPADEPTTEVVVGTALEEEADGTLTEVVVAEEVTATGEVLAGEVVVAVEELPAAQEAPGEAGDAEAPVTPDDEAALWVLPKDGACPDGYPVKAKVASRIYHVPGGTSYARTTPDRCYATPADAESDGFRPAKR
jgi:hypothetical protein